MTRESPPELFAQRPVRSDFGRRRSPSPFTPRRVLVIFVLLVLAVIGGVVMNMTGGSDVPESPEAIPNIQAELPIKQKPEQPGGVDIPHQDVAVFQQLDQKNGATTPSGGVEQLLPAPETPQAPPAVIPPSEPASAPAPAPAAAPVASVEKPAEETLPPAVTEAAAPEPAKAEAPKMEEPKTVAAPKKEEPKPAPVKTAVKKVEKTVKAAEPAVSTRLPAELFTTGEVPAAAAPAPAQAATPVTTLEQPAVKAAVTGKTAQVQLASYPDDATAQREVKRIQSKYAGALGGTSLRVVRADLGAKGTYYRIVSESVAEGKAKAICSDLAKQKASCLLVK